MATRWSWPYGGGSEEVMEVVMVVEAEQLPEEQKQKQDGRRWKKPWD